MIPSAKIIADSIYEGGPRLTTFEVTFHRFVLAEFNTHRVFSRNSASSRAIPFTKQYDKVIEDPALPVVWATEKAGMQGGPPLTDPGDIAQANANWTLAAQRAAATALALREMTGPDGETKVIHKSLVNRLLEPFQWHTAIVTATAWDNFFAQRCHPAAQPEIRQVAEAMLAAYEESQPQVLRPDEWHLPYIDTEDLWAMEVMGGYDSELAAQVSAARCARVSYLTHDGKRSIEADLDLYAKLTDRQADAAHAHDPIHWSPLEHVATPWPANRQEGCIHFGQDEEADHDTFTCQPLDHLPRIGNLLGWRSLRTTVESERREVTYR